VITRTQFLNMLFGGSEGQIHLVAIQPEVSAVDVRVRTTFLEGVEKFIGTWANRNIYFGVATRRTEESGTLENCAALNAVFAEIDFKDSDEATARLKLAAFTVPPSVVIFSGGGLHCYWLLDSPLSLSDGADWPKRLLQALARATGGDLRAAEPARVLRLPGTRNLKYDPPRDVVIESFTDRHYSVEEITAHLTLETASAKSEKKVAALSKGERNDRLFREACRLREFGHSEKEILALLKAANGTRVQPPLPDRELETIARSASRYEPGDHDFALVPGGGRKGEIKADDQHNIRLAIAKLEVVLRYNAFASKVLVSYQGQEGPLDDAILHRLWLTIDETFHFRPTLEFFQIVVDDLARRSSYHPVRGYLSALTWDGMPRIDNWLTTYAGVPETLFSRAVGAIVLVAAVRRVIVPGCKFDELLILESPQGTNKSSMLRALCPREEWFSDDLPLGVDSKQVIERTAGKWIIEASELHGYSNADVEKLKAQLSRQTDGPVRLAYGRVPIEVPRQFIPAGTGNPQAHYLRDSTGNRRFWPVAVDRCDVEAIVRDRDQLWAEAAVREASGASIRLPEELWAAAGDEQDARRAVDPFEDLLEECGIDFSCEVLFVEDLWNALGYAASFRKKNDAERLAQIVQRHGFTRRKKVGKVYVREDGLRDESKRLWAWVRGGTFDDYPDEIEMPMGRAPLKAGRF
jgi:hypothetical protein